MYTDQAKQSFEMGFSRKEFIHLLGQQHRFPYREQALGQYTLDWQDGHVLIQLGEESTRQIASMVISKLAVDMDLTALAGDQRKSFLGTFFKTFLKGGG